MADCTTLAPHLFFQRLASPYEEEEQSGEGDDYLTANHNSGNCAARNRVMRCGGRVGRGECGGRIRA